MEPHVVLKLKADYGAAASRILRKYEKKAAKRARDTKSNFPTWQIRRESAYVDRIIQRKENRAIHLARAFLKGTPYKVVEQSTREGNTPNVAHIHEMLWVSGSGASEGLVKEWLNG